MHRTVDLDAFDVETGTDPAVQAVRERVSFGVDDGRSYTSNAASVVVETATGTTHELVQEQPPGTHENPLTDDERREKFVRCGTKTLGERAAWEAFRTLDGLPEVDDVAELTADLRPTESR